MASRPPGEGVGHDVFVLYLYLSEVLPYLYPADVVVVAAVEVSGRFLTLRALHQVLCGLVLE